MAHRWLDRLQGIEIGPSSINPFGLKTRNVGLRDPIYEDEQRSCVGEAVLIDIVATADELPLRDESEDFIVSSHVLEHCPDLIRTLVEWFRVIRKHGYLFMIVPRREAAPSDRGKPVTQWEHFFEDFLKKADAASERYAGTFGHCHYHVFDQHTLMSVIHRIFGNALLLVDRMERDDKVGNGFTLVYRKEQSLSELEGWSYHPHPAHTEPPEGDMRIPATHADDAVLVSAVVSAYNSEMFMRGCLEDLTSQTLFASGRLEIVVVDSGSEQDEASIVREYQARYPNIRYLRSRQRETIYKAWNRGIRASRGTFITNCNTDDRHRADALEILSRALLEADQQVALVYADVFVTNFPNQPFDAHIRCGYQVRPDYRPEIMLSGCHMGPQPMWRRDVHTRIGMFNKKLQSAGDYEFWCRAACRFTFKHVSEFLGLYYENPKGVCNANRRVSMLETAAVQEKYRRRFPAPGREIVRNYQYTKSVDPDHYVNIGMVTYNRLPFTRNAIESVLEHTRYPYVLTVVDNHSRDGTAEYLSDLKRKGCIKNLVLLPENVGIAKASNLAWSLEPAAGYYLKLDNDIVIQKQDWLENMVGVARSSARVGAVAYNFEPRTYPLSEIDGVRCRIKRHNNLGGACILIPKKTHDQLGFWCERYGLYGEEDADFGERVRLKGLLNVYMEDENIGMHLPAGRAAAIDPNTLTAADGREEVEHGDYRRWKDSVRRSILRAGVYKRQVQGYRDGSEPLYQESRFASEFGHASRARNAQGDALPQGGHPRIEAERRSSDDSESCLLSVIIVTFNSLQDLPACLDSVKRHTRLSHEVIVVDNTSRDGTVDWLERTRPCRLVLNTENLGFARGCNQGIRLAKGRYVALLNPDTIVTPDWDRRLIGHFETGVGAVGPISNHVAGLQKYERYTPTRLDETDSVERISETIYRANSGRHVETKLLIGFCMIIPREVLRRVGVLDEALFLGNDDLEYSWRLRENGLRLRVACDTFIYHKGQASFASEPSSKTQQLVQQSTDALYRKLVAHYGGWAVPSANELWGMHWFKPSAEAVRDAKLVSIVILACNQLHFTRQCIAGIVAHTPESIEVVVVDNGSVDGTREYFEAELPRAHPDLPLTYIRNPVNSGYAAGNNIGIRQARGDFVVLLNNDVVVTPGWLTRLLNHASGDPGCGIVGPMTNSVCGPQKLEAPGYDLSTLEGLNEFAAGISTRDAGKSLHHWKTVGFCMLVGRDVLNRIGGLDTEFGFGNYEDDDFCIRAYLAGFRPRIARDCYVHHHGGATFIGEGIDYRQSMRRNWAIFCRKWDIPEGNGPAATYRIPLEGRRFDPAVHRIPLEMDSSQTTGSSRRPGEHEVKRNGNCINMPNRAEDHLIQCAQGGEHPMSLIEAVYESMTPALQSCNPEDGIKSLQNLVKAFPDFARAYNDLGLMYHHSGQRQKALGHLEYAVRISSEHPVYAKNLADYYFVELGRSDDALAIYRILIEAQPADVQTLMTAGHMLVGVHRFAEAQECYAKVLKIEPWNAEANGNSRKIAQILAKDQGGATRESGTRMRYHWRMTGNCEKPVPNWRSSFQSTPSSRRPTMTLGSSVTNPARRRGRWGVMKRPAACSRRARFSGRTWRISTGWSRVGPRKRSSCTSRYSKATLRTWRR